MEIIEDKLPDGSKFMRLKIQNDSDLTLRDPVFSASTALRSLEPERLGEPVVLRPGKSYEFDESRFGMRGLGMGLAATVLQNTNRGVIAFTIDPTELSAGRTPFVADVEFEDGQEGVLVVTSAEDTR